MVILCVLLNHLVLFINLVSFVTFVYCIISYTGGANMKLQASLHIFFEAVQHPPPLHALLAHVVPQHPLLHAVLHFARVDFLFSHPTSHDNI
jgi:hypothetical protein